jgi:hypothetical protein
LSAGSVAGGRLRGLVLDEDLAILERYRDRSLALDLKVEVQRQ